MRSGLTPGETSIYSEAELGRDAASRLYRWLYNERWTGASLALHAVMLLSMALMPPKSSALALDMLNQDLRYARYLAAPVERDPAPWLTPGPSRHTPSGAAADGSEGATGTPQARERPRRLGRSKPAQATLDPRSEAARAGIVGVLPVVAKALGDAPGLFTGTGVDYDPVAAIGALVGPELGASSGIGALGLRGTGRGGGGDAQGSVGVGRIGQGLTGNCPGCKLGTLGSMGRTAHVPRIRSDGAEVRGAISKEAIRRTIQRHLNEVRFCYENALRTQPELSGRIQVAFLISSTGAVQQAHVVESGLHHAGVERCIAEAVRRWSFPAPDGGGYVSVRYPFVFEQVGR